MTDWTNIVIAACTMITTLVAMKFWLLGGIEKRLDKIDNRLDAIDKDLRQLDSRISMIEGYLMGRNFRTGTEK